MKSRKKPVSNTVSIMFQTEVKHTEGDEGSNAFLSYDEMMEDMIREYSNDQGGSEISAQFIGKVEAKGGEAISKMLTESEEGRDGKSFGYVFFILFVVHVLVYGHIKFSFP